MIGLTLPYLAALTPAGWDITLIDEQLTGIDFDAPVDLVAMTTWTINSFRAYEIADAYRQRGVPVIMGGPHTYFYPDESAEHCDAVGIGEGETIWPAMLDDFAHGRLKKCYHAPPCRTSAACRCPVTISSTSRGTGLIKTYSVQASRGCPFECEFCSERFYLGHALSVPARQGRGRGDQEQPGTLYLLRRQQFRGTAGAHDGAYGGPHPPESPLVGFVARPYLCNNGPLMDLAARSGLLHLNLGIESIDQETLRGLGKTRNKVKQYKEILENLRKRDISYSLNFIFGWDTEREDIFASTLAFLRNEKVPAAYFNILTPHKGTPLYDRMLAEDRIIDIDEIGRWPGIHCHIKPSYCSSAELETRVKTMYHEFYSYSSMFARLPLPIRQTRIASWIVNLEQRKVSRPGDDMENFDLY